VSGPRLTIHLFGPLRATEGDRPLPASGRREVDRLLALLLVLEVPVPRDALATRLWPDEDRPRARARLRAALHYLQRYLPPAGDEPWVRAAGGTLGWSSAADAWCDLFAFRRCAAPLLDALRRDAPLDVQAVERLKALAHAPLLDGLDDAWVALERERTDGIVADLRERIGERRLDLGDPMGALREAQAVIAADPTRERSWRLAIRSRLATGDLGQARLLYQDCAERLRTLLGVAPSAATSALVVEEASPLPAGSAGASSPSMLLDRGVPHPPASPAGALPERPSVLVSNPLAQSLVALLAAHRLVVVVGPPGAGKTWLAIQAAHLLVAQGGRAWWVDIDQPTGAFRRLDVLLSSAEQAPAAVFLDAFDPDLRAVATAVLHRLQRHPWLRVVVVGRRPTGAHGEAVLALPELNAPAGATPDGAGHAHAGRLFAETMAAHRSVTGPSGTSPFGSVAATSRLVAELDGHALAVVRAAAWCASHSVAELAGRLDEALVLLDDARPAAAFRAPLLGEALEQGYAALAADERAVLRRLAAFPDAFSLEAAGLVSCGGGRDVAPDAVPEVVAHLIDRALVVAAPSSAGAPRFRLLRPVRWHARAKLAESGEAQAVASRWLEATVAEARAGAP